MVRPMVNSSKHYVQFSIQTVDLGTVDTLSVAVAQEVGSVSGVDECREGCKIKAVYLELWGRAGSTVGTSGQMIFFKRTSDGTSPSTTDMAALGLWDNKKNIFYTTQGLFNDQDADAIALYKGWIKIPKSKQRMGLNDRLMVSIFAVAVDLQICGFATYKEYF